MLYESTSKFHPYQNQTWVAQVQDCGILQGASGVEW